MNDMVNFLSTWKRWSFSEPLFEHHRVFATVFNITIFKGKKSSLQLNSSFPLYPFTVWGAITAFVPGYLVSLVLLWWAGVSKL
jgi:hypothetical protein